MSHCETFSDFSVLGYLVWLILITVVFYLSATFNVTRIFALGYLISACLQKLCLQNMSSHCCCLTHQCFIWHHPGYWSLFLNMLSCRQSLESLLHSFSVTRHIANP